MNLLAHPVSSRDGDIVAADATRRLGARQMIPTRLPLPTHRDERK